MVWKEDHHDNNDCEHELLRLRDAFRLELHMMKMGVNMKGHGKLNLLQASLWHWTGFHIGKVKQSKEKHDVNLKSASFIQFSQPKLG